MTSPLAISMMRFDPRTRFGFSNFCIGSEHISADASCAQRHDEGPVLQ